MITWITENVAIGEYTDARNVELLKKEKIDCIFNLRVNNPEGIADEILEETLELCSKMYPLDNPIPHYYHIEVGRHQGLEAIKIELRTAAYMLELLAGKYERILVHCTAGMDRAPFVVAYWLHKYSSMELWDFNKAYSFVKKKRPFIVEHYEWI